MHYYHYIPVTDAGSDLAKGAHAAAGKRDSTMVKNFEDLQQVGKDNVDIAVKSFGALSKGGQAIAVELADYSKKSFEQTSAAVEKLMGVKSIDKAIEVQTDYAKTAYEGFMSNAAKLGELYADVAKQTYKPFETLFATAAAK